MSELNQERREEFNNFRIINETLRKYEKKQAHNHDRIQGTILMRIYRAKKLGRVKEELVISLEVAKRLRKWLKE